MNDANKSIKNSHKVGSPPVCSGVAAVQSRPKSHTFTVILVVFAPSYKDGVTSRDKVYSFDLKSALMLALVCVF